MRRVAAKCVFGVILAVGLSQPCVADSFLSAIHVGPQVGAFWPSSSKTADRFGDSWFSLGVGFGGYQASAKHGTLSPDFDIFYQSRSSNHAFFMPVGASYQWSLGRSGRIAPYAGLSGNGVLTDLRADQDGIRSRFRMAYGGSVFAGVQYGRHAQFEVRYYAFTPVRTLDLSGLSVQAGYRF